MTSQFLNFFTTKRGRKIVGNLIAFGGFCLASLHVLPHSFYLGNYQSFYQMYRAGKEVPLPENVQKRVEETLGDCKFPEHYVEAFKFFTSVTFDVLHGGSTKLKTGVVIGLPITFSYETVNDVNKEDLLVDLKHFNFQSTVGQELLTSLILSDKAQKFAIAREIHASTTHYPYAYGGFVMVGTVMSYSLASSINNKFNLFLFPRATRLIMYALTGVIGYAFYIFLRDGLNYYYEKQADECACGMGKDYILGGIEFYQKLMARNIALRSALGEKGKKLYTSFGNEEMFIRTSKMPVSAHLDLVKDKLTDYETRGLAAALSS